MTSLCERTAHKSADSTRSENRVSHRPPPSAVCTPFYTASTRLGGLNATCPQYRLESRRADSNRFPAYYECAVRGCCVLQRFANSAYLGDFLYPGLARVASYCAPGGIRVVSLSPFIRATPKHPRRRGLGELQRTASAKRSSASASVT